MTQEFDPEVLFAVPEQCRGPEGQVCEGLASNICVMKHYVELIEAKRESAEAPEVSTTSMERMVANLIDQNVILSENCPGLNPKKPKECQSPDIVASRRPFDGEVDYHTDMDKIRDQEKKHIRGLQKERAIRYHDDETPHWKVFHKAWQWLRSR